MSVRVIPSSGRRRRWPLVLAGLIVLVLVVLSILSGFFIDLLWFREVHFSSVFWAILKTKILLGAAFGLFFFLVLYANLLIVRRLTPSFGLASPETDPIDRYRVAFEPYIRWLLPLFSLAIAIFVGIGVGAQWQTFLLWRNSSGVAFGNPEPIFGRDPAFYVFSLPWLEFMQGWLFSALTGITFIVAIGHYLWGGIRPQSPGEKVTAQVKAHLSVLLGLVILVKAWGYQLGKFDLLTSPRGVVTGASYTDVHAQLPALKLLVFIAIACALLFLVNIRFRGWALPVLGVGLLALASTVVGGIFPTAIQKFSVDPQELQREHQYIDYNIAFTRRAFGLDAISAEQRPVVPDLASQDIRDNQVTVDNIRLWDPLLLKSDYEQLQRIKQFYEFNDVDVDRYPLDGQTRMAMVSAREVSQDGIPNGGTWQNRHLVFTHGYGSVASQVNTSAPDGSPLFVEKDIPPQGQIPITPTGARVYYGEREDVPFVVVRTGAKELDYQGTAGSEAQTRYASYAGEGGIPVGGWFQRALFAWRYRDVNLLISKLVHDESRIMIYRDIQQRVPKAAPFLRFDGDPYSAVVGGRIVWIWDAYTTTDAYPYSEEVDLGDATGGFLSGTANYIRNSVKVVVDAYDGTMTYYVSDPSDPIIKVWTLAFPDLFTPMDAAPAELRAHFRYPENLFQVQASQYTQYHVTNATVFYNRQDFWQIPGDPTVSANAQTPGTEAPPLRPYYVLVRLPGDQTEHFSLFVPFTPQGRQNMVAWMSADSDPTDYGKVQVFDFPGGRNVDGPVQVFNEIVSFPEFSAQQTLLGQGGSRVLFGNFLVIPINESFLYVQPVFVQGAQENSFPVLKRVVVVHGGNVAIGNTLQEAIANSFAGEVTAPPEGGKQGGGTLEQQVQSLLDKALAHFGQADDALKSGDLATYQEEIRKAQQLVQQANALAASGKKRGAGEPSPGPTPSPSPTPSVSVVPSPTASP